VLGGAWIPPAQRHTPFRGNAGNIGRPSRVWQRAREVVRSGQLGRVAFCRSFLGDTSRGRLFARIDCVQFVFDEASPVSVSVQGSPLGDRAFLVATFRYPGFVASYEQCAGIAERTVICGTEATLVVGWDRRSNSVVCRVSPGEAFSPVWTPARQADSARLVETALREARAIDCRIGLEAVWT